MPPSAFKRRLPGPARTFSKLEPEKFRCYSSPVSDTKLNQPEIEGQIEGAPAAIISRRGLFYALGAYIGWGFIPLYFHALAEVSPWIILCHRVVWCVVLLSVLVTIRREWALVWPILTSRTSMTLLSFSAVFIAINWLIYIYAVVSHQVIQASLGYFINPLLSVLLGMVFMRERLGRLQWAALALAFAGVLKLSLVPGGFPWLALSLAFSFGLYGLVRKKVNVNSLHGVLIETGLLLPAAIPGLMFLPGKHIHGGTFFLLTLSGVITATPLLLFGGAVRLLPLSTMGFLQYIAPTLQFLVAVVLFGERLDRDRLLAFSLCWAAVGIYLLDTMLASSFRKAT
jgi:chloramphenicol-sensitive protein RarD